MAWPPLTHQDVKDAIDRLSGQAVYVTDPAYGAVADGDTGTPTDNTTAFAAAAATGKYVFVPDGSFAGNFDLDPGAAPKFIGAGIGTAKIKPNAGHHFIDANRQWSELCIMGLDFVGGLGAIRNRYTGSNVTWPHLVIGNRFRDYTSCAISHNSTDMPLWKILLNAFRGVNDTSTIGVALTGLTDLVDIDSNEWQRNKIHIKLGYGGNNAKITKNDFVQYTAAVAGNLRANVWVVPRTTGTNAGPGFSASDNKHGNENLGTDDRRFLYADEGSGTYFGDRLPNISADSTGYIVGHTIGGGELFSGGGIPIIYTTTPNIRGSSLSGKLIGGSPTYAVQYRTPTADPSVDNASNVIGPLIDNDNNYTPFPVSNQQYLGVVIDPQGTMRMPGSALDEQGGARSSGYVDLLGAKINSFTLGGAASRTTITDSIGGQDAIELTVPGETYKSVVAGALRNDRPIFVEFEIMQGSSDPLTEIYVQVGLSSAANGNHLRRVILTGSSWQPYRFKIVSASTSDSNLLKFKVTPNSTGTKIKIGRVRMYHAFEPVLADLELPNPTTATTVGAAGGATAQPATPVGYLVVPIAGTLRKIPYHNV